MSDEASAKSDYFDDRKATAGGPFSECEYNRLAMNAL
jgi:hypothetical protein